MEILESTEWEATILVSLPQSTVKVHVEVPEADREEARDSVDLRPFVKVRPEEPCPPEALEQARDLGLVALLGNQANSSA